MSEQMNMEELLAEAENAMPNIEERTVVTGEVIQVSRDEAYVDIGYKQEIAIPKRELAYPAPESAEDVVKVGDKATKSMFTSFPWAATTAASFPRLKLTAWLLGRKWKPSWNVAKRFRLPSIR